MTWDVETGSLAIYVYVVGPSSNEDRMIYEFQCCTYSEDGWVEYNPIPTSDRQPIGQFSDRRDVIKAIESRAKNADARLIGIDEA